ncbi:MAG: hypothetical protein GY754_12865 [bacterium]|nr:hypothetical protein [bacterium]
MYRNLDPGKIVETLGLLNRRIKERFPGSGLSKVSGELLAIGKEASERSHWINKPNTWLRVGAGIVIFLMIVFLALGISKLNLIGKALNYTEFIQVLEAGINDIILVSAAIFFLVTFEARIKRSRALKLIHELRSFAHVIDMHQLTKDPKGIVANYTLTASSPKREMSMFEVNRYLHYCSELLSLIGKISALYVQSFNDPATIAAVNDVENLTTGLSRKIWQKIVILQSLQD